MASDQLSIEFDAGVIQDSDEVPKEAEELLSDPYNRYVLRFLHEHRTAKLEELVDVVFGAEVADSDRIATPATREPVRSSICNSVLPELDELDYIEFDPENQTVTRGDVPQEVFSAMGIDT